MEGKHGKVVVLLGTVTEQIDVSLKSFDHATHTLRGVRCHQLDDAVLTILFLPVVLRLVQSVGVEQHHTAAGQVHLFAHIFQVGP